MKGRTAPNPNPLGAPSLNEVEAQLKAAAKAMNTFGLSKKEASRIFRKSTEAMNKISEKPKSMKYKNHVIVSGPESLLTALQSELHKVGIEARPDELKNIRSLSILNGEIVRHQGHVFHYPASENKFRLSLPVDWDEALELIQEKEAPKLVIAGEEVTEITKDWVKIGCQCIAWGFIQDMSNMLYNYNSGHEKYPITSITIGGKYAVTPEDLKKLLNHKPKL